MHKINQHQKNDSLPLKVKQARTLPLKLVQKTAAPKSLSPTTSDFPVVVAAAELELEAVPVGLLPLFFEDVDLGPIH
jgi:hypothetical protein